MTTKNMADNFFYTSANPSSGHLSRRFWQGNMKREATGDFQGKSGPSSSKVFRRLSDASRERVPGIKNLRTLVVKLSPHLNQENLKEVAYLMGGFPEDFDEKLDEHSKPVRYFVEEAERVGQLTDENFDLLIKALKILKLKTALEVVKKCKAIYIDGDSSDSEEEESRPEKRTGHVSQRDKYEKTARSHWVWFQGWCKDNDIEDPKKANGAKVKKYLEYLQQNRVLKIPSIRGHLNSIKRFHDPFSVEDAQKLKSALKRLALKEKISKSTPNFK